MGLSKKKYTAFEPRGTDLQYFFRGDWPVDDETFDWRDSVILSKDIVPTPLKQYCDEHALAWRKRQSWWWRLKYRLGLVKDEL